MIAILFAAFMTAAPPVAVSYQRQPLMAAAQVYQWREAIAPLPLDWTVDRAADSWIIHGHPGVAVVVLFRAPDGRYLIDGPFVWPPRGGIRTPLEGWRRSDRGTLPADAPRQIAITWLRADGQDDVWPRCFVKTMGWECWGVQNFNRGVLVMSAPGRMWSAVTNPTAATRSSSSRWGRLVVASGGSAGRIQVTLARPVPPPSERLTGIRLETGSVAGSRVAAVTTTASWVTGEEIPPAAWVEIRGREEGPVYMPLADVANGSVSVPHYVTLPAARVLTGAATSRGQPASGALITISRLIDPPAPPGSRLRPRRVFAAEITAADDGTFSVSGIGEADYEVVAWHSALGRASAEIGRTQSEIVLQLAAPAVIRGRVVRGGKPLVGVDVISVPDAAAFNTATDLIDVKGGDASTGADGRFAVIASSAGGGELRVGGGGHAVTRVPLPRSPPSILELGDIDISPALEVFVVLDRDPRCPVRAVGPAGRSGLQVVPAALLPDGRYRLLLPEMGMWEFGLVCQTAPHTLLPGSMRIGPEHAGQEVRFVVR